METFKKSLWITIGVLSVVSLLIEMLYEENSLRKTVEDWYDRGKSAAGLS